MWCSVKSSSAIWPCLLWHQPLGIFQAYKTALWKRKYQMDVTLAIIKPLHFAWQHLFNLLLFIHLSLHACADEKASNTSDPRSACLVSLKVYSALNKLILIASQSLMNMQPQTNKQRTRYSNIKTYIKSIITKKKVYKSGLCICFISLKALI